MRRIKFRGRCAFDYLYGGISRDGQSIITSENLHYGTLTSCPAEAGTVTQLSEYDSDGRELYENDEVIMIDALGNEISKPFKVELSCNVTDLKKQALKKCLAEGKDIDAYKVVLHKRW